MLFRSNQIVYVMRWERSHRKRFGRYRDLDYLTYTIVLGFVISGLGFNVKNSDTRKPMRGNVMTFTLAILNIAHENADNDVSRFFERKRIITEVDLVNFQCDKT